MNARGTRENPDGGSWILYPNALKPCTKHWNEQKAIDGFINLNEEQQIKAEETIHLLNRDPGSVIVKRKVFSGKKHKATCFEILFAYNGRLYFMNHPNKTEVVLIGTKQTQNRDMEYLHNL